MAINALVQTRIDPEIKDRAAAILDEIGMTVTDAVRILLTRTANEGVLPFTPVPNGGTYDAWLRAKVREVLKEERTGIPEDQVREYFASHRSESLAITNS